MYAKSVLSNGGIFKKCAILVFEKINVLFLGGARIMVRPPIGYKFIASIELSKKCAKSVLSNINSF